jgi:hypothetical protein
MQHAEVVRGVPYAPESTCAAGGSHKSKTESHNHHLKPPAGVMLAFTTQVLVAMAFML